MKYQPRLTKEQIIIVFRLKCAIIFPRGGFVELLHGVLLVIICIGAGFVQRVSGFGLGIFAMIFLPHMIPAQTGAAICTMLSSVTSTYNAVRYRKNTVYKTAFPMLCAAMVSIPLAVRLSRLVSGDSFRMLLGVVLVGLSLYFLLGNKRICIKPNLHNGIVAGTLGGVLNGLFATGGPPIVLYLSCAMPDKLTYFATIQFYFAFTNIYATIVRAVNGLLDGKTLLYAAVGMIGCFIGDFLGRIVFDKLDSNKVKFVVYIGMIISGILMLV